MWSTALVIITNRSSQAGGPAGQIRVQYNSNNPYTTPSVGLVFNAPNHGNVPFPKRNRALWRHISTGGYPYLSSNEKSSSFHNFVGITIPQGATINSATITLVTRNTVSARVPKMMLNAVNGTKKIIPAPSSIYNSAQTVMSKFLRRTATAGTPFVMTTPTGTKREKALWTPAGVPTGAGWANPSTNVIDVKNMIQRLVNTFDYNNDEMVFQVEPDFPDSAQATYNYVSIYTQRLFSKYSNSLQGLGYQLTTATSMGTSIFTPKLVIDYSLPQIPVLRSCRTVDALLIAQGSIHGRCGDEAFW